MIQVPIRVCLVSPLPPPYGGIANWTRMVCAHAARRADVELAVISTAQRWRSIHTNGVVLRAVGGGIQLLRDGARLIATLIEGRCDAVHLTTSGHLAVIRDLLVSYLTRVAGVGMVYHIRFGRLPMLAQTDALEWRLIRRVMLRAAKVILIDRASYLTVKRCVPEVSAVYVANCIDPDSLPRRVRTSDDMKTALFVGWVIPSKGVSELLDVWARLNPPGWRLEIIGPFDHAYHSYLLRRFKPTNVEFRGELPHAETMKRIAACDLFVLPSYTEGFPNVVLEAMMLGRPIVATRVGAIPEMLADGAGITVERRDLKALEEALARLLIDSDARARIGQKAHAKSVLDYSIGTIFGTYMEIWHAVSRSGIEKRGGV